MTREEFYNRQRVARGVGKITYGESVETSQLISTGKDVSDHLLAALAEREGPNKSGKVMTIAYIRTTNSKGHEISGYIDLAQRFNSNSLDGMNIIVSQITKGVFTKTKRFLPRSTDLSFYNWVSLTASANHSPNFTVLTDSEEGILFKSKRDRNVISVNPEVI